MVCNLLYEVSRRSVHAIGWSNAAPIARIANTPNVVVVHPSVPAASMKELVALIKSGDARYHAYAHPGVGTPDFLVAENQEKHFLLSVSYVSSFATLLVFLHPTLNRRQPVALIRWGTTARQETVTGTLADIVRKAEGLEPPAVAIFGDVVGLRSRIAWLEPRSLAPGDAGPPVSAATLGVRRAGDLTRRSPRSHGGKGDASHPFDSGRASRTHSSIQEEAK